MGKHAYVHIALCLFRMYGLLYTHISFVLCVPRDMQVT